tara:strand:+ start:447 stop:749 length:303 start_codon:yes stop_codon:yes gene_type:complete
MTEINIDNSFDKFEKEKLCNLLQCSLSDLEKITEDIDKIVDSSTSTYEILLKILQQGNNIREATFIGILCGKYLGYNEAKDQMEDKIKQKLFDAFNNQNR